MSLRPPAGEVEREKYHLMEGLGAKSYISKGSFGSERLCITCEESFIHPPGDKQKGASVLRLSQGIAARGPLRAPLGDAVLVMKLVCWSSF